MVSSKLIILSVPLRVSVFIKITQISFLFILYYVKVYFN